MLQLSAAQERRKQLWVAALYNCIHWNNAQTCCCLPENREQVVGGLQVYSVGRVEVEAMIVN